ncbi:hypothetical protein ACFL09_06595 [Planctomycetota bacterium]
MLAAHGMTYELRLVGGPELLDKRPAWEPAFQGFRFARSSGLRSRWRSWSGESIGYRIGYIFGTLLVLALVVWLVWRGAQRLLSRF